MCFEVSVVNKHAICPKVCMVMIIFIAVYTKLTSTFHIIVVS